MVVSTIGVKKECPECGCHIACAAACKVCTACHHQFSLNEKHEKILRAPTWLPQSWSVEVVKRNNKNPKSGDVYLIPPGGPKLRSRADVERWGERQSPCQQIKLPYKAFNFAEVSQKMMASNFEVSHSYTVTQKRNSRKRSMEGRQQRIVPAVKKRTKPQKQQKRKLDALLEYVSFDLCRTDGHTVAHVIAQHCYGPTAALQLLQEYMQQNGSGVVRKRAPFSFVVKAFEKKDARVLTVIALKLLPLSPAELETLNIGEDAADLQTGPLPKVLQKCAAAGKVGHMKIGLTTSLLLVSSNFSELQDLLPKRGLPPRPHAWGIIVDDAL